MQTSGVGAPTTHPLPTLPRTAGPLPVAPTLTKPTSSARMQGSIQRAQADTDAAGQTTGAAVVARGHAAISASSAPGLLNAHSAAGTSFNQSDFGQTVKTLMQTGGAVQDQLDQVGETVTSLEVMGHQPGKILSETGGAVLEALRDGGSVEHAATAYLSGVSLPDSPEEGAPDLVHHLVANASGFSAESVQMAGSALEWGATGLKAAQAGSSILAAYQKGEVLSAETGTAIKQTYELMGGESTVEAACKIGEFCQNPTLDTGKEMLGALHELHEDDSLAASLTHTAVRSAANYAVGSTATGYVAAVLPGLSYATAAIDSTVAAKKGYDWYQGNNVSGYEATQSLITAAGSVAGATVAPVVGPLIASGLNLTLDATAATYGAVSSAYSSVSNWWQGSGATV